MTDIDAATERCAADLDETTAKVRAAFIASARAAGLPEDVIHRTLKGSEPAFERAHDSVLADFRRNLSEAR